MLEDREFHCPQCGYNLRGIPEVRCPECGFGYQYEAIDALAADWAEAALDDYLRVLLLNVLAGGLCMLAALVYSVHVQRFGALGCVALAVGIFWRHADSGAVVPRSVFDLTALVLAIVWLLNDGAPVGCALLPLVMSLPMLLLPRRARFPYLHLSLSPDHQVRVRRYRRAAFATWTIAVALLLVLCVLHA